MSSQVAAAPVVQVLISRGAGVQRNHLHSEGVNQERLSENEVMQPSTM